MKILVVDDHPMVRKGLAASIAEENDVDEVKEASGVDDAMTALIRYRPEVMFLDLRLGNEDGLEIINRAKKQNISAKFIVLTSSSRKEDFQRAQEMGADGYILKEAFIEDILYAFRVVARGKKYYDPEIMHHTMKDTSDKRLDELTEREKDVLIELGKGLSNGQIAERLYISEHTVKKHISNVLAKLDLKHRTEAALLVNNIANKR